MGYRLCKNKETPHTDTAVRQATFTHAEERSRSTTKTMLFRKTHAGLFFFKPLQAQNLLSVVLNKIWYWDIVSKHCWCCSLPTISAVNHIYKKNKINLIFHSQDKQLFRNSPDQIKETLWMIPLQSQSPHSLTLSHTYTHSKGRSGQSSFKSLWPVSHTVLISEGLICFELWNSLQQPAQNDTLRAHMAQ